MTSTATNRQVVRTKGDAVGKITGLNHMILFVSDMTQAIHFYRDILGLEIIKTLPAFKPDGEDPVGRNYFMRMADGSMIGFAEYPGADAPSSSVFAEAQIEVVNGVTQLWPGERIPPKNPQKIDHFAFNVPSRDDLVFYQERLREHGYIVSEVIDFIEGNGAQFVMSIYFFDPFGNPLEISTFDLDDPDVEERLKRHLWWADRQPPAALFE